MVLPRIFSRFPPTWKTLFADPLQLSAWPLLWLVLASSLDAGAGQLWLHNGDRIQGELVRVNEQQLVWRSDVLGEISVDKAQVRDLETDQLLKINGVVQPCMVEGMDGDYLVYLCRGDYLDRQVALATLDAIIPYQNMDTKEAAELSGRVAAAGNFARGNEERDDLELNSRLIYRLVDWRHRWSFDLARFSDEDTDDDLRWTARYSLDWFFRERWFLSGDLRYGRDETRAMDRFVNLGLGSGYQWLETRQTKLALVNEAVLVREEFETPELPEPGFSTSEERFAWRFGLDFQQRLPLGVSLSHRSELVQSLEDTSDRTLETSTGLSTLLVDRIRSEVRVDYELDNEPQQDTEDEDLRVVVGLTYEW